MANDTSKVGEFLIARGGPFYNLQKQLGILHDNTFRAGSRAVIFVLLAWGAPFVISLVEGHAFGNFRDQPFILALAPWSRYFIAVGLFVLMEQQLEKKLCMLLDQFERAPILAPDSVDPAARAVSRALRRRDSRLAEAVCLLLAIIGTVVLYSTITSSNVSTWAVQLTESGPHLTLAGWWVVLVSNVIFGFLLFRWLWRHVVWALLLRDLARLELRLVASHPDGFGGLGFIGQYPNTYVTYILAVSFVIGTAIAQEMLEVGIDMTTYGYIMACWLAVVLALFVIPLMAFKRPLDSLKDKTLLASSARATQHFRATERDVLGANIVALKDAESSEAKDIPDSSKLYAEAKKLGTVPFSRTALLPISAAALLPLVAAGATQLPFKEILVVFKRLLAL